MSAASNTLKLPAHDYIISPRPEEVIRGSALMNNFVIFNVFC